MYLSAKTYSSNPTLLLAALILVFPTLMLAQEQVGDDRTVGGVTVKTIKLFSGSSKDDIRRDQKARRYTEIFSKQTLRYVFLETAITDRGFRSGEKIVMSVRLRRPDRTVKQYRWNTYAGNSGERTLTGGMGWATAGRWMLGIYKADVYLNNRRVGSKSFTVVSGRNASPVSITAMTVVGRRLTSTFYPRTPTFRKSTTKGVYLYCKLRNGLYGMRNQRVSVRFTVYFRGRIFYNTTSTKNLRSSRRTEDFWTQIVRKDGGRFSSGEYNFVCRVNGNRGFSRKFTITK